MKSFFYVPMLFLIACSGSSRITSSHDDGKLEVVFVQINDVYEIAPLEGGKAGGMARVATIKKQYLSANPNTFLLMAGDFLSPSIFNSLQYQGKAVRGRQMVDVMNTAGVNFAVFGNHEFDIKENELQERINESSFQWVASNTFHKQQDRVVAFRKTSGGRLGDIPHTYILSVTDSDGTRAKIGFIGITLSSNRAAYVSYTDPLTTAEAAYNQIKDSCDAVVAITHQAVGDDIRLAEQLPSLALIAGGHEHNMQFKKQGNVYITKAHSNARSAYVIRMDIDKRSRTVNVFPELKCINDSTAMDSTTDAAVKKWVRIAEANYDSLGFDVKKVVLASGDTLDGRETEIRARPTNLTNIIVAAMAKAAPAAEVVLFNAGSVRVDDLLPMPVTEYDILRCLPFGGGIREVGMSGSLLGKVLETGRKNKNSGGFLHFSGAAFDSLSSSWKVGNEPIDASKIYRVALTDYMLTGMEVNFGFLNADNPDIIVYDSESERGPLKSDIRLAIVSFLEKRGK